MESLNQGGVNFEEDIDSHSTDSEDDNSEDHYDKEEDREERKDEDNEIEDQKQFDAVWTKTRSKYLEEYSILALHAETFFIEDVPETYRGYRRKK